MNVIEISSLIYIYILKKNQILLNTLLKYLTLCRPSEHSEEWLGGGTVSKDELLETRGWLRELTITMVVVGTAIG